MLLRFLCSAVAVAFFCSCGTSDRSEELISDSEIDAIATSRASLTSTPAEPTAGAFHLRVAWGYLAGKRDAPSWVDWTGSVRVDAGSTSLESLNYFERSDFAVPSNDPRSVAWSSHTRPHFDGLVAKVAPAQGAAMVHFQTPAFEKDLTVSELASGFSQRYVVDAAGHEVSISSVPDAACGGFAFGYLRPAREGWLAFGGLFTDASGQPQGRLRMRAEDGKVEARLVANGKESAQGTGTLTVADQGGSFRFTLVRSDGVTLGEVRGSYADPSYSPRGSFQATLRCP